MFRSIRHMEGKVKGGSTSKITTVSDRGHITELTSKESIEQKIVTANEKNIIKLRVEVNCYNHNLLQIWNTTVKAQR